MGYDERHQSSSSGVAIVLVAVAMVTVLGIVLVGGAALFWLRADRMQSQAPAVVAEQRAVIESHTAELKAKLEEARARSAAAPDPRLTFEMTLDRAGNTSVDGRNVGLDDLRAKLAKLKDETSNAFSVHIKADSECPVKHVVAVVAVCDEVGDIDYLIKSFAGPAVQMTATVASYKPAAEWDHFDDGTFSAYDILTLNVAAPERLAGTALSITVPSAKLPEDSAFRSAGTRLTFTLRASDLSATRLSWGAIDDPTIVE